MPEILLGIDIGSETVKAILAAPRGRTDVRILAHEVLRFEGIGDLEAVLKKMAETILPHAPSRPVCVVSLSPSEIMFRQIRLPFRDENKIKKTLPFELEPLLPVPVEEVVADYVPLPDEGLLAAACSRDRIRQIISAVESCLGEVAVIDISAAALALPLLEQKAAAETGILLDVGASSTVAVFYEKNAIVQIRSLAFGGNTITGALAGDLACEIPDAEKAKIDATYGTGISRAAEACCQFCAELANTAEFLRLNETLHGEVAEITVTGGGALFEPLLDQLEKTFGRPVELFDFTRFGLSPVDEKLRPGFIPLVMNTALAAVRRAAGSHKSFNFRQGEFATRNILTGFRTQLKWAAVAAGIILFLAACDLILDYSLQSRQASHLKNEISQIFKRHFPPHTTMVDPVAQLKARLAEERKTYGLEGSSGASTLQLLKEISGLIPSSLDVVLTHYHYENNGILLKGEAKKVDDITAVKNGLLKSTYFKNVTIGSTRLAKEGAKVDFDMKVELK